MTIESITRIKDDEQNKSHYEVVASTYSGDFLKCIVPHWGAVVKLVEGLEIVKDFETAILVKAAQDDE